MPRPSGCASARCRRRLPVRSTSASSVPAASSTISAAGHPDRPRSERRACRVRATGESMSRSIPAIAFAFLLATSGSAQAPAPQTTPAPTAVWTLTADLAAPESAYHDPASNSVFVSSINGQILEKDGNGYISRLTPDGKVVAAKWVTGLNAPKGMRSVAGTLWVSDIDEVVGIEISSGRITARVRVDGSQFLNDLATAPDGTVYVADSAQS